VSVTEPPVCRTPVAIARFWPSLLIALTEAILEFELAQVNVSPDMARPNWSNPVTENEVELPACTLAVKGVTEMLVSTAAGRVVVRVVLALIPSDEAVMVVVPPLGPPAPVANPPELMLATLGVLLVNVNVMPVIGLPY
jgi:hypothetical protein